MGDDVLDITVDLADPLDQLDNIPLEPHPC